MRGGTYAPFIPPGIAERTFAFRDETAAVIAQATRSLAEMRSIAPRLMSVEALAQTIERAECLASSRIEGVHVSYERLAAVAPVTKDGPASDPRAREVLGNVDALQTAIAIGRAGPAFTIADVLEIHRKLLASTEDPGVAGVIRERQHWIGGDNYNPLGADFVPPPPEMLRGFLEDLCAFIERDDLPPPAQAAIAHAQFKNIHPFAAGNGRTGRALIYAILRRHGEIGALIPPVSAVLASQPKAYVGGLGAYSVGRVDEWCATFARALTRAVHEGRRFAEAVEARVAESLERLGNPRSDSAVRQILVRLPGHPVVDAGLAETWTGKSHTAVHNALNRLEDRGILEPLDDKRWGRAWRAAELLQLGADFERQVSSGRS